MRAVNMSAVHWFDQGRRGHSCTFWGAHCVLSNGSRRHGKTYMVRPSTYYARPTYHAQLTQIRVSNKFIDLKMSFEQIYLSEDEFRTFVSVLR